MPLGRGAGAHSGEKGLARARVRFLTDDQPADDAVRDAILASWTRSRQYQVAPDQLQLTYQREPDLDTPLTRGAEPVLRHLSEQLDGQPLSIVLTDASGLVLSRHTTDDQLARHLDRVHLAPGFSYAESASGTNGIGTTLEVGRPMHVFGHEHFAEDLQDLACAAAPIRHPVSGRTIGAVDLTCWRRDAGALLLTLAKSTAGQVTAALLAGAGRRELDLLHAYLRACSRTSGMVLALSGDVVMMNDLTQSTLRPDDQAALIRHANQALTERPGARTLTLPSGTVVRTHHRHVRSDEVLAGGVVEGHLVELATPKSEPGAGRSAVATVPLPGVVGAGALWRRAVTEVTEAARGGAWLVLEGEAGVGKLALVRAVHQRSSPGTRFTVVEATAADDPGWLREALRVLDTETGTIVLRRPELLAAVTLRAVSAAVQAAATRSTAQLVLTTGPQGTGTSLVGLLQLFPRTVVVPPLRHHAEDVQLLVPFLVQRLGHGGRLSCSPEAMQLLVRHGWSGNVAELLAVLRRVVTYRRSGTIQATDLPADMHSHGHSRRRLTPLEAMERDAIIAALLDSGGSKPAAAAALGLSRATVYRKIRDYGIVSPPAPGRAGPGARDGAPSQVETSARSTGSHDRTKKPTLERTVSSPDVYRLTYRSHSLLAADTRREVLGELFSHARAKNKQHEITGALLITPEWFVQTLEGDESAVQALFERIESDPRHDQVVTIAADTVPERVFGRWSMAKVGMDGGSDTPLIAHEKGISAAAAKTTTPEQEALLASMRDAAHEPA